MKNRLIEIQMYVHIYGKWWPKNVIEVSTFRTAISVLLDDIKPNYPKANGFAMVTGDLMASYYNKRGEWVEFESLGVKERVPCNPPSFF